MLPGPQGARYGEAAPLALRLAPISTWGDLLLLEFLWAIQLSEIMPFVGSPQRKHPHSYEQDSHRGISTARSRPTRLLLASRTGV